MTKYISIISDSKGVGKTISAINLATSLAILGRDTTLLDANFPEKKHQILMSPSFAIHIFLVTIQVRCWYRYVELWLHSS